MTKEIARDKVLKNRKGYEITNELDLPKWYVFSIKPKGGEPIMDPYVAVDKKTGKVSGWNPMMDIENFKKAMNRGR